MNTYTFVKNYKTILHNTVCIFKIHVQLEKISTNFQIIIFVYVQAFLVSTNNKQLVKTIYIGKNPGMRELRNIFLIQLDNELRKFIWGSVSTSTKDMGELSDQEISFHL